jgi:hypothetical protein
LLTGRRRPLSPARQPFGLTGREPTTAVAVDLRADGVGMMDENKDHSRLS